MKENYILLTNDVETHSIYFNSLRADTGGKVYKYAIPYLLDLYQSHDINSTFFITGYIAKLYPDIVKIIAKNGHEIASHGLVHEVDKAFDVLSFKDQVRHLKEAKHLLEDLSGQQVISFRAPALRVNHNTPSALEEAGFKIDSSISPQRIDFFLSFGTVDKIKRVLSPRKIYYTSKNNLARRGRSNIVEVPVSSFCVPFVGSLMRANNLLFRILRAMLVNEARYFGTAINYYMHPTEFIEEFSEGTMKVNRRTDTFLKYLFADIIRRKIKLKNLGSAAKPLYEEMITYFNNIDFKYSTIKEYCHNQGFLK